MSSQNPKVVTFKMRKGKKIEMVFNCLWGLFLSAIITLMTIQGKGNWTLPFILFMIFLILIPIAGIVFFASTMMRSSLTFSEDGLCFRGAFSSKRQASWQEVKGFYENAGEMYLKIQTLNGKPEFGIPISWFAKMRFGKKSYPADTVMNSLLVFAPHLFIIQSSE